MSKVVFRGNLTASYFPLVATNYGQSIAIRDRNDSDYIISNAFSGSMADVFIGIPIAIYMHNCLPSDLGIRSVGYKEHYAPLIDRKTDFDQVLVVRDQADKFELLVPAQGQNYVNSGYGWQSKPALYHMAGMVTTAHLKGRSYICYEGNGVFLAPEMTRLTLGAVEASSFKGICAVASALVAFDKDTIYWSSFTDPLDFQPQQSSAAGSESVLSVQGEITCVLPYANGAIIYTSVNAVAMQFSGNIRQPWNYRIIPGAAGVLNPEHVTSEAGVDGHFAWTTSGLQIVRPAGAELLFPEVTDFLSQGVIEDWIGETGLVPGREISGLHSALAPHESQGICVGPNVFLQKPLQGIKIKLALIGKRFLAISYGEKLETSFGFILVYDFGLRRWGKLRIRHVDAFELPTLPSGAPEAGNSFGILQSDGHVVSVDSSGSAEIIGDQAVLVWGNLQTKRGGGQQLLAIEASNTVSGLTETAWHPSLDSKQWLPSVRPFLVHTSKDFSRWQERLPGLSHAISFTGPFHLTSLVVTVDILSGTGR